MPGFLNDGTIEEDYTLEFWEDFAKVTYKGKIYAKIGGRLYARHAVDRMLPSALGKAAGGEAGRSIPTSIVEEVIRSGNKTTRLVDGIVRTEHIMGNVSVVTEEAGKVVVTVMRK